MAMTKLEKRFVNRPGKAEHNIARVRDRLNNLEGHSIQNVLELGCGMGAVSAFLAAEYKMNVMGTDFDPEQIEIARSLYPETELLHYQVEDASSLTFSTNSFDLVISQNVFHHIPIWEKAVQEVARVLKSHGYFIWLDLALPGLIKTVLEPIVKSYSLYTVADVQHEFLKYDFTQLYYGRISHGPFVHHHLVLQKP
jgi:ubiquinone/menaquinone biosynthesis C-methylase UbiE